MTIQAFGYLGVGGANLEDWTDFATKRLGMQAVEGGAAQRAFRMDDRRQRLVVDSAMPVGTRYFGWEVADAAALDALAAKLEAAGVAVRREPASLAGQRFVTDLMSFSDPSGNRLEAFHGPMVADTPFSPGRLISGFRCGPLGMGHVLMTTTRMEDSLAFYCGLLGFGVSDFMRSPVQAYFLHVNARHHSLALIGAPVDTLHHLMVELYSLDDVGQGYDLAVADGGDRVVATLGRHCNDLMTSFYQRTPGDILVECGWGAREVTPANWQPVEISTLASHWGHAGLMRAVGGEDPPPVDLRPGGQPVRAPVYVMEGNYEVLSGVCPWWDGMKARA